jgi:hypothetical protein
MHVIGHIFGLDSSNSTKYLFWSGIGSDLTYLGVLSLLWHHVNCHEKGCWRPARHQTGGYCRKHRKATA